MQRIFISSVMNGYEAEREAAAAAIESLDLRAVHAGKTTPASSEPSRTALLGEIDRCDGVVLILGARYGWVSETSLSPTEEEFNYASATDKPVFAFVQKGVEREPQQAEFIRRVEGGWTTGRFREEFETPGQLTTLVVRALNSHLTQQRGGDAVPAARDRARTLAAGDGRLRGLGANFVRVVLVPVGERTLIDALVLDDVKFKDRVSRVVRDTDLVPQSAGIVPRATSAGVVLVAKANGFHETTITFAADGAIVADLDVRGDGTMGGMVVSYPRVQEAVARVCRAAQRLWAEVPNGDLIGQVAAVVAVPESDHSPLSLSGKTGGSMRVPTFSRPKQAPEPPLVVRRAEIGGDRIVEQLAVSLKQVYADEDAVVD